MTSASVAAGTLEAVLADAGTHGDGPYAAAFADLVRRHRTKICESFTWYDAMAASLGEEQQRWVITHGEPKADNTLITASGPALLDWDTVRLAPPARDIWMTESVDHYCAVTGRQVPAEQLDSIGSAGTLMISAASAAGSPDPIDELRTLSWDGDAPSKSAGGWRA